MKPKASLPRIATTSCAKHRSHHRHLFLLLLVASFPSNFAANNDFSSHVRCVPGGKDNLNCGKDNSNFRLADSYGFDEEDTKVIDNDEKPKSTGMECPLEPKAFRELKATVPSAIRDRMRQLSKKVPTIESATEIAHSIEILKLFDESSPHLDGIREEVHKGAQMLRTAFDRIGEHITDQKSVPSEI